MKRGSSFGSSRSLVGPCVKHFSFRPTDTQLFSIGKTEQDKQKTSPAEWRSWPATTHIGSPVRTSGRMVERCEEHGGV